MIMRDPNEGNTVKRGSGAAPVEFMTFREALAYLELSSRTFSKYAKTHADFPQAYTFTDGRHGITYYYKKSEMEAYKPLMLQRKRKRGITKEGTQKETDQSTAATLRTIRERREKLRGGAGHGGEETTGEE